MEIQQPSIIPEPKTNALAVASMVLGIIALLFSFFGFLGLIGVILGIIALILSIVGKKQISASGGTQKGSGMAVAGLVMGIIAVVIGVIAIACAFACMSAVDEFEKGFLDALENWDY